MGYTLDQFASDCRSVLQADAGIAGQTKVCEYVSKALNDADFVEAQLGQATEERAVIYQDADLGFCICAHSYTGEKQGNPHDHGPTWAIYGQAVGETSMTDWKIVKQPAGDQPGEVVKTDTYVMKPGDAHLYPVGAVHAPYRDAPTKLIRVEGVDTMTVKRTPLKAAS
tara:strand:- start:56 stop:559 length:504 start_codon:yes stop_codon:yes gene_type:complete